MALDLKIVLIIYISIRGGRRYNIISKILRISIDIDILALILLF